MTTFNFLDYRIGLIGKIAGMLAGILGLCFLIFQNNPDQLLVDILKSILIVGLSIGVISKERFEDERLETVRMKVSLYLLGSMLPVFAFNEIWLMRGPDEFLSASTAIAATLILYHVLLQIWKRVV